MLKKKEELENMLGTEETLRKVEEADYHLHMAIRHLKALQNTGTLDREANGTIENLRGDLYKLQDELTEERYEEEGVGFADVHILSRKEILDRLQEGAVLHVYGKSIDGWESIGTPFQVKSVDRLRQMVAFSSSEDDIEFIFSDITSLETAEERKIDVWFDSSRDKLAEILSSEHDEDKTGINLPLRIMIEQAQKLVDEAYGDWRMERGIM